MAMIKKLLSLALLVSCTLAWTACQPGDEEPPAEGLTLLDQSIPELLGYRSLSGYHWQGTAAIESCSYLPLSGGTIAGCSTLQEVQNVLDGEIAKNMILTVDPTNGISATLVAFVPHFNLLPNGYTLVNPGSLAFNSDRERISLTLTQGSVTGTPTTTSRSLSMTSFTADDLDETLRGRVTYVLTETGKTDSAVLEYSFDLAKVY